MKLKLLSLLALCISLAACTKDIDESAVDASPNAPGAEKIVNMPEGATAGVLAVKVSSAMAETIEQGLTRSDATRTGVGSLDASLDEIDASRFSRLLQDAPFEADLRAAGLHLWYKVSFDDATDLTRAAEALCRTEAVSAVEYMHPHRRPISRTKPVAAAPGDLTRAASNDPGLSRQWHYHNTGAMKNAKEGADINLLDAWDICAGDESIVVAVIDEPVEYTHEDLAANMWVNTFDSEPEYRHGANFCTRKASGSPLAINLNYEGLEGHGTHVAGTVSAVNGNGKGVCGVAGGKNGRGGVKIMTCQIFDETDLDESAANAMIWAANRGAHIAQCSYGYDPSYSENKWLSWSDFEADAIEYFITHPRENGPIDGGLVIFASGNDGNSIYNNKQVMDLRIPPGCYASAIAVAAIGPDFLPGGYTCYGDWIDISAPGGDGDNFDTPGQIYSTLFTRDGGYGYIEGTSMACPHVSGVAALGLSYAAKLGKHFTVNEFRDMLLSSTNALDPYFVGTKESQGYEYPRNGIGYGSWVPVTLYLNNYRGKMGGGLVDAYKMLMAVEGTPVRTVATGSESLIPLDFLLGGAAQVVDLTVADNDNAAQKLGLSYTVEKGGLKVSCTKAGAAKLTVKCIIGETEVERTFALVSRRNVTSNGGWL